MSLFKDVLTSEIHNVFLNSDEFAERIILNGKSFNAVVDRSEMGWPEADDRPGVSNRIVVLGMALSDFPDDLWPGKRVEFNGDRWTVDTADREAFRTVRLYREAG